MQRSIIHAPNERQIAPDRLPKFYRLRYERRI